MHEKEKRTRFMIPDAQPRLLETLSEAVDNPQNRSLLIADQMSSIGNDEVFSGYAQSQTRRLMDSGLRVNEFIECMALMRFVLNVTIPGGYPALSPDKDLRITPSDLSVIVYEQANPNTMTWVKRQSRNYSGQEAQARRGLMSTYALAYKELSPQRTGRKFFLFKR